MSSRLREKITEHVIHLNHEASTYRRSILKQDRLHMTKKGKGCVAEQESGFQAECNILRESC